jgi:regulator of RNase E activity RraA
MEAGQRFMDQIERKSLDLLAKASTATIQSQLFKLGLRNTFLYGLRPVNPLASSFVGEAFTLRYIPAREDIDTIESFTDLNHPQRFAIEQVQSGQVLVMDCRQEGRAASGGEILMTRLKVRGAAAVITDGSIRDSHGIAGCGIPVFSSSVSATINLALHHAVDFQVPIACAGVPVYPGDILVGDLDGVVVVPRHLVNLVAAHAVEQERLEDFILERIAQGAPLPGTYPPDQKTLAEFHRLSAPADTSDSQAT